MKKNDIDLSTESKLSDEEAKRLRAIFAEPVSDEDDILKDLPPYRPPLKKGEVLVTMISHKDNGEECEARLEEDNKEEDFEVPVTFNLTKGQVLVIEEGISIARSVAETEEDAIALEYIVLDWIMSHDPEKVNEIMDKVSRTSPQKAVQRKKTYKKS